MFVPIKFSCIPSKFQSIQRVENETFSQKKNGRVWNIMLASKLADAIRQHTMVYDSLWTIGNNSRDRSHIFDCHTNNHGKTL